ncbi:MAG: hypothetical protein RIT04_210 [Candidatus Parcubacteria bacterium]|jgi:hypothetical protein
MNLLKNTVFILVFLLFLSIPLSGQAQQLPTATSIDGITLSINPETPVPNAPVAIQLVSYITNLSGADIVWYTNGKIAKKGKGETTFTTTAPQNGKTVDITVVIKTIEGRVVEKKTTIAPSDVDLLWETDGYVPPFYRGKITGMYENAIRIIAMPHFLDAKGVEIDPKTLLYTWEKSSLVLGDLSGYGKQTLVVPNDSIPRPYTIKVQVSSADGKYQGSSRITLDMSKPFVLFYPEDPLYGALVNTAVGSRLQLLKNEVTVLAAPFGFSTGDTKAMRYSWSINGEDRSDLDNKREILLRVKNGISGNSSVALRIRNERHILQSADNDFNLFFNTENAGEISPSQLFQ